MNIMAFRREGNGQPPAFGDALDCLEAALPSIAPPRRMSVAEAAAAYRRIDVQGAMLPWRNDVGPYMVEPMNATTRRRVKVVAFVGPARSLKTDALINNVALHRIICEPCYMRVVHMSKDTGQEYSETKLSPMIRHCPELAVRLGKDRSADNIFSKKFQGGMRLTIGWPVASHFAGVDLVVVAVTEYDHLPDNIDGEGDALTLGRKRTQTFGGRGITIIESSPRRPIEDEDWRVKGEAPHEAPPCKGILGVYNQGSRGRWYWYCPTCRERFEPDFSRLQWQKDGTINERAASVEMVCPNGCLIPPDAKMDLNAGGEWLHEAPGGELVRFDDLPGDNPIASYWLKGPAAAFQPWHEIVANWLNANAYFEATGDEGKLVSTVNTDQGLPYRPKAFGAGSELSVSLLKSRAERYPIGVAPAGTRFITVQVDVQARSFVVQVDAWGVDLERWMIDRFDLHTPPAEAPGAGSRSLDPAKYREDWRVLRDLLDRAYPVAGSRRALRPVAQIVDSHGESGVTPNAYAYYRTAQREGLVRRVFLCRGRGGFDKPRAWEAQPEKESGRRGAKRSDLRLVNVGTDTMKDEISAALARVDPGPGAYHLSDHLPENVFDELCAERRTVKRWEKKPGVRRNEALDLAVYGKALVIVLKGERINWTKPPAWAAPIDRNSFAIDVAAPPVELPPVAAPPQEAVAVPAAVVAPAPPPQRPVQARRIIRPRGL